MAALYAASYARLVGQVGVVAQNRHEAEEAVQEAFVRLMGRWARVSRYEDPEAWARKVALGFISNRRRKLSRGIRAFARHASAADVPEPSGNAVDLKRALDRLPHHEREVVVLQYAGLSVDAIAQQLGIPTGTVKSRLSRARIELAPSFERKPTTMSDLHQAVQERAGEFRPRWTPPLVEIQARKDRRDRRRLGAAIGLAVIGVAAVGAGPRALGMFQDQLGRSGQVASESPDRARAAVRDDGIYMLAEVTGTLSADAASGCLWLEGSASQLLLQGRQFRVDFLQSPPAIYSGDLLVARVGQRVIVGGGFTERVEPVPGCPVSAANSLLGHSVATRR